MRQAEINMKNDHHITAGDVRHDADKAIVMREAEDVFRQQVREWMVRGDVADLFDIDIKNCTTMRQVFKAEFGFDFIVAEMWDNLDEIKRGPRVE